MKHKITPAERRHMDYLRRKGMQTCQVYEKRLRTLRRREVKRVLDLCRQWGDNPDAWEQTINANLDESYLEQWEVGLYKTIGLPRAESSVRDLNKAKASGSTALKGEWLRTLTDYGIKRAGANIVIVQGTLRETLIQVVRDIMAEELGLGIEKLTKAILGKYDELARWQVRRIAQTESMIAMGEASNMAAKSLDIGFTKQWAISGLGNTRDSHIIMDGVEVDQDEPFYLEGGQVLFPHDYSMGAAASEIINCACDCIRRPK